MGGSGEAQASPPAAERIDFALERGRHRRFVGREDVLARLDEWLLGPDDTTTTSGLRPTKRAPYIASPKTGETRMTADDLFNLLSKLLPAQFEAVLFRARVPIEYLPAATALQAERAMATIRYFESQSRLDQLARAVLQVVPGGGVGTDPR